MLHHCNLPLRAKIEALKYLIKVDHGLRPRIPPNLPQVDPALPKLTSSNSARQVSTSPGRFPEVYHIYMSQSILHKLCSTITILL